MQQESYLKCSCEICGENIEFPAEAAGQSIPCPHCAQNTKLSQLAEQPLPSDRRRFRPALLAVVICAVLGIAMAIGIFAAKRSAETAEAAKPIPESEVDVKVETKEESLKNKRRKKANAKSTKASQTAKEWNGLKATHINLKKTDNSRLIYATGTVHNKTDRQRFGVKVELDLFDAENAKLGSATDYVQVIEPKKDWGFKALVTDPKAVRAELTAITEN
jgi:hypothetical protein